MKLLVIFLFATILLSACGAGSSASNSAQPDVASSPAPKVVYTGSDIKKLKDFEGKRVREIELWEAKDIDARLSKMLGDQYAAFKEGWLIESPISSEGDILMAAGCGIEDCAGNQYVMFVDIAKDNINVQHLDKGKLKMYKEKEEIALPEKFAADLAVMKSSGGVN